MDTWIQARLDFHLWYVEQKLLIKILHVYLLYVHFLAIWFLTQSQIQLEESLCWFCILNTWQMMCKYAEVLNKRELLKHACNSRTLFPVWVYTSPLPFKKKQKTFRPIIYTISQYTSWESFSHSNFSYSNI